MSIDIKTAVTSGLEMNYIKFGTGEKTFVILPGLSVQSVLALAEAIEAQYKVFTEEFTVYLFDRRSSLPEAYSVFDMADDTAAVMSALGLKDTYLFGASQGGAMGIIIAANYPSLVKKLAVSSIAPRVSEKSRDIIIEWINLAKEGDAEKLYLSFAKKLYPKTVFEMSKSSIPEMAKSASAEDLKRFIILASGTEKLDLTESLSKIKCPFFSIGDTSDEVFGADYIKELDSYMKDSALYKSFTYSGFGHAVYDTVPGVAKQIFDFFTEDNI